MTNHRARYSKRFGYNDNYRGPEPKRKSGGFLRDVTRLARRLERANLVRQKGLERAQRQAVLACIAAEKVRARMIREEAIRDVEEKNQTIGQALEALQGILAHTLEVDDTISFESLTVKEDFACLSLPQDLLTPLCIPDRDAFAVKPLNWLAKLLPGVEARHLRKLTEADRQYREAVGKYKQAVTAREAEVESLKKEYAEERTAFLREAEAHNREVEAMRDLYAKGDASAVEYYNDLVLDRSEYPESFPQEFDIAYDSAKKTLRIEYRMPPLDVVPTVKNVKYLTRSGETREEPRGAAEIDAIYKDVVVAVALRSIHETFEADQGSHVDVVEFEGESGLVDRATGRFMKMRLSAEKREFTRINLAQVDKLTCFKKLGGKLMPA